METKMDEKNYIKRQLEKLYGNLVYEDRLVARGISLSLEILNGEVSVDCEEDSESL